VASDYIVYAKWAENLRSKNAKERTQVASTLVEIAGEIKNKQIIGLSPVLHLFPVNKKGSFCYLMKEPTLLMKISHLPVLVQMGTKKISTTEYEDVDVVSAYQEIGMPCWGDYMEVMGKKEKLEWRDLCIKSLTTYQKKSKGKWLSDVLQDERKVEFMGISRFVSYFKLRGSTDELAEWVHPFGTPAAIFRLKEDGSILYVSAGMRFNATVLQESDNYRRTVIGITG